MLNSEKLGVGKTEDSSRQSAGFQRPASQVGWYKPIDFFLLSSSPCSPPKYALEPEAGWAAPKALFVAITSRTSTVSPWFNLKRGGAATPPVGLHCRSWLCKVGKAPWAVKVESRYFDLSSSYCKSYTCAVYRCYGQITPCLPPAPSPPTAWPLLEAPGPPQQEQGEG